MKITDLEIVIDHVRGSYKKFADTVKQYPVLGVTFPTHYGYIKGYIGEDQRGLDIFLGTGSLLGYIRFERKEAIGGVETKMFLHISEEELDLILKEYEPVVQEVAQFETEDDFLEYIDVFRDKQLSLIAETSLYVDDIDAARDFYVGVLGLEVLKDDSKTKRDLFLRCGKTGLFLFDPEQTQISKGRVPAHGAIGAGHIAFSVDKEDLSFWENRLTENGIDVEKKVDWEHKGTHSIYFRDPSGNSLEFIESSHWGK